MPENLPVTTLWPAQTEDFSSRHIGPRPSEIGEMLRVVGASSLDDLIDKTIPAAILDRGDHGIGAALTEQDALARLRQIASRNQVLTSMIGQGYYDTVLPPVIQRNILENPAWYTAYTPYQPEISQGRLEALLNFQTLVADLTGLDIANASLLDEGTACAEAMALAQRVGKSKATAFFVDADTHPQTIAVIRTRAEPLGWDVVVGDPETDLDASSVFGALLSYPGSSGQVRDPRKVIAALHEKGAIAALACDPLALVLLESPGALGADIAIGSMQRYGVPMGPVARMRHSWRRAMRSSGTCRGVWSACRATVRASRPIGWRFRRASSISAAKRRRPTSARRRPCWRLSHPCMRFITVRKG